MTTVHSVLVVDDTATIRFLVTEVLSNMGYEVREAVDSDSALQTIESSPVDLVLSDLRLGAGMGGVELLRLICARYPETRGILMSGSFDPGDLPDYGFALLPKPFTVQRLKATIAAAQGS